MAAAAKSIKSVPCLEFFVSLLPALIETIVAANDQEAAAIFLGEPVTRSPVLPEFEPA
jgi:hypothetical protein